MVVAVVVPLTECSGKTELNMRKSDVFSSGIDYTVEYFYIMIIILTLQDRLFILEKINHVLCFFIKHLQFFPRTMACYKNPLLLILLKLDTNRRKKHELWYFMKIINILKAIF